MKRTPLTRKTPLKRSRKRLRPRSKKRAPRDAEYLVLRDLYLEENPKCVLCDNPATQIHHIVGGTAGRPASLLNTDTWLGVCGQKCHETVESFSSSEQITVKVLAIRRTVQRLRRPL